LREIDFDGLSISSFPSPIRLAQCQSIDRFDDDFTSGILGTLPPNIRLWRLADMRRCIAHVCYWPKADMS